MIRTYQKSNISNVVNAATEKRKAFFLPDSLERVKDNVEHNIKSMMYFSVSQSETEYSGKIIQVSDELDDKMSSHITG